MVQLIDADIKTREVLNWKGLHVFHFPLSSCSQKLRIFLNLKGVKWESHVIDLPGNQNISDWYLGINPRGLVPTLVHDGAVHIESNDIITYVERIYPEPKLVPDPENDIAILLKHEDDLHFDLRSLSFRFVFAPPVPPKTSEDLARYASAGSGTVRGSKDAGLAQQIDFWTRFASGGVSDDAARLSALTFRAALGELDDGLETHPYLLGETLTVLDIAWFVYVNRLSLAGYPVARLHPRVAEWFGKLITRPEFAKEIFLPDPIKNQFAATRQKHANAGKSLELIAGW